MMIDLMRSKALAFIFFVVGVLPPEEITGVEEEEVGDCVARVFDMRGDVRVSFQEIVL